MRKKILVTGGAGYIGSHTVAELSRCGYEPIIADDFSNSFPNVIDNLCEILKSEISLYTIDCKDTVALSDIFKKEKTICGVVHFAAHKSVEESVENPIKYYKNNILSLVSILEVMQNFKCINFVFSSSCTVYGQSDQLPVTEEIPSQKAESPYGNTKKICEEIIVDTVRSQANIKAISLRYFNPIGAHPSALIGELPRGIPKNLISFITQTAVGIREKLTIFGNNYNTPDGTCIRDYLHVVDLAQAHVKSLEYLDKQQNKNFIDIFNIGTGQGHSVLEIVRVFEKISGKKLNYEIGEKRSGDIEKIYANVSKAIARLNWKAKLSLEDALQDAWRWQKRLKENDL